MSRWGILLLLTYLGLGLGLGATREAKAKTLGICITALVITGVMAITVR
jgi:hypothetical protein